jgi:hypothetical protein
MEPQKDPTTLSDWVYKMPMLWTSEWAAGKDNEKEICDAIIHDLHLSGLKYGIGGGSVRAILVGGGGMCGGWHDMFQHLAHCQGVFVHRRCFLVDWRSLPGNEVKWKAIVIRSGGLNQPAPTWPAAEFHDVDAQYPITSTTPINAVTEKRYSFWGFPGVAADGHCINFLEYDGKLYLYDPSFGTGPFQIATFGGPEAPLPPEDLTVLGGTQLTSFKKEYLDSAVDYMLGSLKDDADALHADITAKTQIIPDLAGPFKEITFYWIP